MYDKNRSGQWLYFGMNSALSGNPVTGIASSVSGRVSLDGGAQALVAGAISEIGGGQYALGMFAADINANIAGYLFTSSGCVPANFTVPTTANVSGKIYPASGANSLVPIASVSGVIVNSGIFASVPIASISGVIVNSGVFASVPIASISGVIANSGIFASVPIASISGAVANSGLNVNADVVRWLDIAPNALTASGKVDASFATRVGVARSGTSTTVQLDAGAPTGTSGIYDGQLISVVAGSGAGEVRRVAFYDSSGNVTVDRPFQVAAFANSIFNVLPAQDVQSGNTYPASGINAVVPRSSISGVIANSGLFVTATAVIASGALSGQVVDVLINRDKSGYTVNSGTTFIASGPFVVGAFSLASGALSGQVVDVLTNNDKTGYTVLSGTTQIASGPFVVVPIASISGAIANSGLFVTVPPATLSGVVANSGIFATVPIASISGAIANSGIFATVPPATLSGVVANSGLFASVPITSISGLTANSGLFVTATAVIASGSLSGQVVDTLVNRDKSGYTTGTSLDKSGYTVGANLDKTNYQIASGTLSKFIYASGVLGVEIPYGIYKADMSGVTNEATRSLLNATRKLMNRWIVSGGVLTVFKEDDSTQAYTQNVLAVSGANPITSLDTN